MHAQVGILALSAGEFRSDIRARGVMNPDLVTIGMMLETSGGVSQWDYDIIPGDIVVFPKSVEQEGRFTGYSSYVTITLSAEDLATHATGERHLQEPEFWAKIYNSAPRHRSEIPPAWRSGKESCNCAPGKSRCRGPASIT